MRNLTAVTLALAVGACTTVAQTSPPRTASEQLLISTAADRAAKRLVLPIPKGTKVFVDATNFDGYDGKYAIGAIRDSIARQGASLVDSRADADAVAEIRAGALSTDQKEVLVGIPSFDIPIPLATGDLPFPEIAFYKSQVQEGVAKFAMTSYNAKDGSLISSSDPQYGFSHKAKNTVLVFFSWTTNDTLPEDVGN